MSERTIKLVTAVYSDKMANSAYLPEMKVDSFHNSVHMILRGHGLI